MRRKLRNKAKIDIMYNIHEKHIIHQKPNPNPSPLSIKVFTIVSMGMDAQVKASKLLGTNVLLLFI